MEKDPKGRVPTPEVNNTLDWPDSKLCTAFWREAI
jgi:hypothetical protein